MVDKLQFVSAESKMLDWTLLHHLDHTLFTVWSNFITNISELLKLAPKALILNYSLENPLKLVISHLIVNQAKRIIAFLALKSADTFCERRCLINRQMSAQ